MRSYPVKQNPIGSAVSEILWYEQTDAHTDRDPVTLLLGLTGKIAATGKFQL